MRLLALPVTILTLAGAASATVLWRGDYDTGNLSQWTGYQGILSRLTLVQSPVRQGGTALRVELHQGDVSNSGTRNEMFLSSAQFNEVEGNDKWYAWSTLFPADYPSNNTWQVFTQWHHSGLTASPPVEFDVVGEEIQLAHNGSTILWRTPLVRALWHDFVVHIYWSSSNGYIDLYYDGTKVLDHQSTQTLYSGQYAYLKQGLYRDASISNVAVLYHDGMVMGTTLADVAPQLVTPPPPPPVPPPDGGADFPDAGTTPTPTPDAGPPPVGVTTPSSDGGIPVQSAAVGPLLPSNGCSHTGSSFTFLGLAAIALAFRRRHR